MRTLVIFFIFLVPSFLSANDISEFQIEGMNVNESVLSYFYKNQIDNEKFYLYEDFGPKGKEIAVIFIEDNLDRYDSVQISFKNDNYEIVSIMGNIYFEDNIDNCLLLQNEISNDIKSLFSDLNTRLRNIQASPSGIIYLLTDGPGGKLIKVIPKNL